MFWVATRSRLPTNLLVATALGLVIGNAIAGAPQPSAAEKRLMAAGSTIVQKFDSAGGLSAIVVDNGKERRLFYVSPNGQALIAGLLFDERGRNVTPDDLSRAGISSKTAGPSPASAKSLWRSLGGLQALVDGKAGPVVYVFADPACPYCHAFMRQARPSIRAGKLQVRWLPMALLSRGSRGLAEAMYRSGKPEQVIEALLQQKLLPLRETPEIRAVLAKNLQAMRTTGYTGVPTIVYRADGRVVVSTGVPTARQWSAMLSGE
ncbi:MAG: thiol:disulfide interchange protein DsbG [Lysobacter sp.]